MAFLYVDARSRELDVLAQMATIRTTSAAFDLFKQVTGVPLRRYKLCVTIGAAMRAIARGHSLTVAAADAGPSSSAHVSTAYRQMFGLEPSRVANNLRPVKDTAAF